MLWDDDGLRWSSLLWFLLSNFCERSRPLQATLLCFHMSWQSCFPTLPNQDFTVHVTVIFKGIMIIYHYIPQLLDSPKACSLLTTPPSHRNQTCLPRPDSTKTVAGKRRKKRRNVVKMMSLGDKVASAFGPSAKHNSKNGNDFLGEAYQPWASVC